MATLQQDEVMFGASTKLNIVNVDFHNIKFIIDFNIEFMKCGEFGRHRLRDELAWEWRVRMRVETHDAKWTDYLSDEDLQFVKRFVLDSGSLKALAEEYRISYPTVRLRLDRLIAKIKVYETERITSEFERQVRALSAEGRIDLPTMKRLLQLHREEIKSLNEDAP